MDRSTQLVTQPSGWETAPLPALGTIVRADRPRVGRLAHWSSVFAVVVLTTVALIGLVASALTYRAGRAWRDRATSEITRTDTLASQLGQARAEAAGVAAELAAVQQELSAAVAKLQRSETDVAQLENRVRELGTEKAQVEDEREAVRQQRASLVEVTQLAAQVGEQLDGCLDNLLGWLARRPSGPQSETPDAWSNWARAGDLLVGACSNAQETNERLLTTLNG